ncbi:hypothetical protein [Streptomyces parvulus]
MLSAVQQIADRARANGGYGPADASAFDRALAPSGRNPGWIG